ncbi:MAG: hypothetical protein E7599_02535 [Ruminococcaceae bacterium]|nr:hypothetical protein [Oscillospiraceae bacterium]
MKKLIAMLLLLAMLVPCFVACGGGEKVDNSTDDDTTGNDKGEGNTPGNDEGEGEGSKTEGSTTEGSEVDENVEPTLTVAEKTALGFEQTTALEVEFKSTKDDTLTYTSSDAEVVTIDPATGVMVGVKEGTATVTVKNADGTLSATTEVTVTDPLKGAGAAFCGDSICMASTWDKDHQWWGWAGRLNRDYEFSVYANKGCDGASVSNCRKQNTIVNQVLGLSRSLKLDFLVLHGGVNDGWDKIEVGTIAKDYEVSSFDVSTFAGGLEHLFHTAKRQFPNAKICYIINFRMNTSVGNLKNMTPYYQVAKVICKKWNVPYLDLYDDAEFNSVFDWKTNKYLPDQIHPNSAGYDVIYPFIARFMRQVKYGIKVNDLK